MISDVRRKEMAEWIWSLLHRWKWKEADSENQKCACWQREAETSKVCVRGLSKENGARRVKRRRAIREFEKKSVKT